MPEDYQLPKRYDYPILDIGKLDQDTDPLVLARAAPNAFVDSRNVDPKGMTRKVRSGLENAFVEDTIANGGTDKFYGSGVYFPPKSRAVVTKNQVGYGRSFYYGSTNEISQYWGYWIYDFWLKCDSVQPYDRYVFRVKHPLYSSNEEVANSGDSTGADYDTLGDIENYYALELVVNPKRKNKNYFKFSWMVDGQGIYDGVPNRIRKVEAGYTDTGGGDDGFEFPCDGEWHRVTIGKYFASPTFYFSYALDGELKDFDTLSGYEKEANATAAALKAGACTYTQSDEPLVYDQLWIGEGGNMSIAEFRVAHAPQTDFLSAQDYSDWISNYPSWELDRNNYDDKLAVYIPFDEGTGKTFYVLFRDVAESPIVETETEGYFVPQEPWLDEDDNLVFSGYDCVAFPSRSSSDKYEIDDRDSMDGEADLNPVFAINPQRVHSDLSGTYGAWESFMDGTYQIRLKLMGLKEGCICGNLWLRHLNATTYRFVIKGHCGDFNVSVNLANDKYASAHDDDLHIVDASWLDTWHTITVSVATNVAGKSITFNMFIDDKKCTLTTVPDNWNGAAFHWYNSTYGDQILIPGFSYENAARLDYDKAMLGGHAEYCMPIKVKFFRSWHKLNLDTAAEISDIWDKEELPTEWLYKAKGFPGWMNSHSQGFASGSIISILEGGLNPFQTAHSGDFFSPSDAGILSAIHTFHTDIPNMNNDVFSFELDDQDEEIRFDIMQRGVTDIDETYNSALIKLWAHSDYEIYESSYGELRGDFIVFNSITQSQCISYYNTDIFNKSFKQRAYYDYIADANWSDPAEDIGSLIGILGLFNAVESGTEIQGYRKFTTGVREKTKFLLLGTQQIFVDVNDVDHMHSVGGQDHQVLLLAHNTVYEYDPSDSSITPVHHFDVNGNSIPNFTLCNNKLVLMDSLSAKKLNHKGNWSNLGIDRPSRIVTEPHGNENLTAPAAHTFADPNTDYHFAYVARFYDSENDAFSGTIPVYSDRGQGLQFKTDTGGEAILTDVTGNECPVDQILVNVNTNLSPTVDRLYIYRTLEINANDANTLYLVAIVGVAKHYLDTTTSIVAGTVDDTYIAPLPGRTTMYRKKGNVYQDIWDDDVLDDQSILPLKYLGTDLVPPKSSAIGVVFNRLCLGNSDDYKNGMYYSEVDTLGNPRSDMVPDSNLLLITQGSPNEITAIHEGFNVGLLFQRESMYRLVQPTASSISASIVSNRVGCLNQHCVVSVENVVYFMGNTGLYRYISGNPEKISVDLDHFFSNTISKANITKSFMLYETPTNRIRCYVPVDSSNACDVCIVYDLDTKEFFFEDVPDITCGYEVYKDGAYTIYLGTYYGNLLKLTNGSNYYDLTYERNDGPTISSTSITDTGATWEIKRYGCCGYPIFLVMTTDDDPAQIRIWKGIVSVPNSTATSLTVSDWREMYNATADPGDSTYTDAQMTSVLGGLYFYFKTPVFNFPRNFYEKRISQLMFFTNKLADPDGEDTTLGMTISVNHDQTVNKYSVPITDANDFSNIILERERGRFHQLEIAGVFVHEFDLKGFVFDIVKSKSYYDG
jgi:hypothetical protein